MKQLLWLYGLPAFLIDRRWQRSIQNNENRSVFTAVSFVICRQTWRLMPSNTEAEQSSGVFASIICFSQQETLPPLWSCCPGVGVSGRKHMLWMEYPPRRVNTPPLPMLSSLLSYFNSRMRSCIFPHSKKSAKHYIKHDLETFATADSPGCPSPTDSEVNMKEPSSSRSLIVTLFSRRVWISVEVKKQMLLGSRQQAAWRSVKLVSDWSSEAEMNRRRPVALQQRQSRLQNFSSEATWSSIYTAKRTHVHMFTHVMWIHGTVQLRGELMMGGC